MPQTKPQHVASIGFLCQWNQMSFHDVTKRLDDAGVKPTLIIDTTMHYDFREANDVLSGAPEIRGGGR